MKDVRLNNGVMMPAIGFGVFQIPADETERIVSDAIEVGYRMFDTAASYFNEEQVGNAIRQSGIKREGFFITTKLWVQDYEYEDTLRAFDKSLKNMDIFEKDLSGVMVSPDEPGYDQLISTIFDTMATAAEMNAKGWLSPEEVHDYLHRITGREIDHSTTLLSPFYVDYGKNIRIGYGSIIGANSVVTHDVPPMTIVGGNPAKFIKKIEIKK